MGEVGHFVGETLDTPEGLRRFFAGDEWRQRIWARVDAGELTEDRGANLILQGTLDNLQTAKDEMDGVVRWPKMEIREGRLYSPAFGFVEEFTDASTEDGRLAILQAQALVEYFSKNKEEANQCFYIFKDANCGCFGVTAEYDPEDGSVTLVSKYYPVETEELKQIFALLGGEDREVVAIDDKQGGGELLWQIRIRTKDRFIGMEEQGQVIGMIQQSRAITEPGKLWPDRWAKPVELRDEGWRWRNEWVGAAEIARRVKEREVDGIVFEGNATVQTIEIKAQEQVHSRGAREPQEVVLAEPRLKSERVNEEGREFSRLMRANAVFDFRENMSGVPVSPATLARSADGQAGFTVWHLGEFHSSSEVSEVSVSKTFEIITAGDMWPETWFGAPVAGLKLPLDLDQAGFSRLTSQARVRHLVSERQFEGVGEEVIQDLESRLVSNQLINRATLKETVLRRQIVEREMRETVNEKETLWFEEMGMDMETGLVIPKRVLVAGQLASRIADWLMKSVQKVQKHYRWYIDVNIIIEHLDGVIKQIDKISVKSIEIPKIDFKVVRWKLGPQVIRVDEWAGEPKWVKKQKRPELNFAGAAPLFATI